MLSRIAICMFSMILIGCASVKLDKPVPHPVPLNEKINQLNNLALDSLNDVAYIKLKTEFKMIQASSSSEGEFNCRDFKQRWVDAKYEAMIFSTIVEETDSKVNSNDSTRIPIVIYQKNNNCTFIPVDGVYISKNNKLISSNDKITLTFDFIESDNNNFKLETFLNDISTLTASFVSLVPGSKAISAIYNALNSTDTKQTTKEFQKYMEESSPEIITRGAIGSYDIAGLENGVAQLHAIEIVLTHNYKKPYFGEPERKTLGTLTIRPEIASTLLFSEGKNGIPIISQKKYDKILNKSFHGKKLYSLLQESDVQKGDLENRLIPKNGPLDAHKGFADACEHVNQLTEALGFNIYDRAGLLYLLLSGYEFSSSTKNWGDFNQDIIDNKVILDDLKKYDNENFYNCIGPYSIALGKMIEGLKISKEEIGKLIRIKTEDENKATIPSIIATGSKFITLVNNFNNKNKPVIAENFKYLLSDWKIKNDFFTDAMLIHILEIQDSTQPNEEKLEKFVGNRDHFVKLLNGTKLGINDHPKCFSIGLDTLGAPNSIKYLFKSSQIPELELGVLELYMNSTGKNISEIRYSNSKEDFFKIEECGLSTLAT